MSNYKFTNLEAIALLFTVAINHIILIVSKLIIEDVGSSSIINVIYISIIAIIFSIIICKLLKNFTNFDILDISNFLAGKTLKNIIGIAFILYFLFFAGMLLNVLSNALQIIYYSQTKVIFISLVFIFAAAIACSLSNSGIFRTNLLIIPIMLISIIFLFFADFQYYNFNKVFPILGNGINATFFSGLNNLFAFQGLAYLFFLPFHLKNPEKLSKVAVISVILSGIFLVISISVLALMSINSVDTDELIPLYSSIRYIEFGRFFQRLDSIFLLILIFSFTSYLSIALKLSTSIFGKLTSIKDEKYLIFPFALLIFSFSSIPKNYALTLSFANNTYKYAFFIFIILICTSILWLANRKNKKTSR